VLVALGVPQLGVDVIDTRSGDHLHTPSISTSRHARRRSISFARNGARRRHAWQKEGWWWRDTLAKTAAWTHAIKIDERPPQQTHDDEDSCNEVAWRMACWSLCSAAPYFPPTGNGHQSYSSDPVAVGTIQVTTYDSYTFLI
jgi:hypothetical protein